MLPFPDHPISRTRTNNNNQHNTFETPSSTNIIYGNDDEVVRSKNNERTTTPSWMVNSFFTTTTTNNNNHPKSDSSSSGSTLNDHNFWSLSLGKETRSGDIINSGQASNNNFKLQLQPNNDPNQNNNLVQGDDGNSIELFVNDNSIRNPFRLLERNDTTLTTSTISSTAYLKNINVPNPPSPPPPTHSSSKLNFVDSSIELSESSNSGNLHKSQSIIIHQLNTTEEEAREEINTIIKVISNWVRENNFKFLKKGAIIGFVVFILVYLVGGCVMAFLIYLLENGRINSIRETTKFNCLMADMAIKRQIEVAITALDNIRETVISWDYNVDSDKFDEFVSGINGYDFYSTIHAFGMTRNFNLTDVYPTNVLRSLIGQDIGADPNHMKQLLIAIETNRTTIFGPYLTIGNNYVLIAQQPIVDQNLNFWGFSLIILEFNEIFAKINLTSQLEGYSIQLFDNNQEKVFYQKILEEHKDYNLSNLSNLNIIYQAVNITIINTTWKLILIPIDSHDQLVLALEILIPITLVSFGIFALVGVSTVFSYYTLRIRADRETARYFAGAEKKLVQLLEEFKTSSVESNKKYDDEEKKLKNIINSLEDALITVIMDNSSKYKVMDINQAFTNYFGFDKNDLDEEKIDFGIVFPNLDLKNEYKMYEERHENREYTINYPTVNVSTKPGMLLPSSLILTFDKERIGDSIFCILLIKPLTPKVKQILDMEIMVLYEQNQKMFMEMLNNNDKKRSFIDFIKKKRNQDERNILFIENVNKYKQIENIQERHRLMDSIIETYMSSPSERLYDVSQESLKTFFIKLKRCPGGIDLFDGLVSIVIQNFFLFDMFERWQREKKNTMSSFIRSKVKIPINN